MGKAIEMRESEARILVYLENASNGLRVGGRIAAKLRMSYCYCLQMLASLEALKWVRFDQYQIKKYYFLTKKAPLAEAKLLLEARK